MAAIVPDVLPGWMLRPMMGIPVAHMNILKLSPGIGPMPITEHDLPTPSGWLLLTPFRVCVFGWVGVYVTHCLDAGILEMKIKQLWLA